MRAQSDSYGSFERFPGKLRATPRRVQRGAWKSSESWTSKEWPLGELRAAAGSTLRAPAGARKGSPYGSGWLPGEVGVSTTIGAYRLGP